MTFILPIDLRNGNGGRGTAFWASHKRRQELEIIIRSLGHVRTPSPHQQHVTITRILGKGQRLFDPDSIGRGDAKELVDALTMCGWWKDDSAKWITAVDYRQDATQRRNGPAVEITVEEAHRARADNQPSHHP